MDLHSADWRLIERMAALHPDAPISAGNRLINSTIQAGAPHSGDLATAVATLSSGCADDPNGSQDVPAGLLKELVGLAMLRDAQRAHDAFMARVAAGRGPAS